MVDDLKPQDSLTNIETDTTESIVGVGPSNDSPDGISDADVTAVDNNNLAGAADSEVPSGSSKPDEPAGPAEPGEKIDWRNLGMSDLRRLFGADQQTDGDLEGNADRKSSTLRTVLWSLFGVACILAMVLPAGYVLYKARVAAEAPIDEQNSGVKFSSLETTKTASTETTKVASPVVEKATKTELTAEALKELEYWDYYTQAKNIFLPMLSAATTSTTGSGTTGATSGGTTGSTSGSGSTLASAITLEAIGEADGKLVGIFAVSGSTYEAKVGEKIGSTSWTVKALTDTSATINNGSNTVTRTLGDTTSTGGTIGVDK